MSTMASQITSIPIVYSAIYSGADQREHQSSALLVFARGIHRGPVHSLHEKPVTWKMFPFDDVIMMWHLQMYFLGQPVPTQNYVTFCLLCKADSGIIYIAALIPSPVVREELKHRLLYISNKTRRPGNAPFCQLNVCRFVVARADLMVLCQANIVLFCVLYALCMKKVIFESKL